jgi:DNA polymerase-3 subunit delta'
MVWRLYGQDWAVSYLKEHVIRENFRHAYLFAGPQGIGRRTLALRFAQALNCPTPPAPGEPCGICRTCVQIERMQHPDLTIVQADRVGGNIKVDQVRDLQRSLALAPYQALYRIALLLRFEEANPNASNALLKILEEPPSKVVLLLTAESAEILLPTIISRCEVMRLRLPALEIVEKALLDEWNAHPETARLLAHLSGGRIGIALQLYQDPERLEQRRRWLEDHHKLLSASRVERFAYAEALAKDRDRLRQAIESWQSLWRDVLLRSSASSTPITNLDRKTEIEALTSSVDMETPHRVLVSLQRTQGLLDCNVNPRLAVEVFMLDLPRLPASRT